MRVRFYLKRPVPGPNSTKKAKDQYNPNAPTSIYALVNYQGESLKIYTGESILPKYWNQDTNSARNTPKFPEHPEFNERLNQIRSAINRVYLDYRNKNENEMPSAAVLKSLIEASLKRGNDRVSFIDYFENFVTRSFNGQRIDPRTKMPVRQSGAKGYQTTLNHLKDFSRKWKKKLDFETIDLEFHHDFTAYLTSAPLLLSPNTIGSNFQRIKAVLNEATEKGLNSNKAYKSKYFVKQTEEADTIYLNETELSAMCDLDLPFDSRLDKVRDLFLIGAHTGLRFSDFSILKPENIQEGFIRIKQAKTGADVIIPIHPVVRKILQKRSGNVPYSEKGGITNEKLNLYLKELGQMIDPLKQTETKSYTKGGNKLVKSFQKWELLTTHTARRSFATNEYLSGTPSITIMAITGHKTEKSFLKYIKVSPDGHAKKMAELWEKRNRKLKIV